MTTVVGDLWRFHRAGGVAIVSVNSEGVHGRGLAKQACDMGFIRYGRNRNYDESPISNRIRTICVKGRAPHTARVPGRAWSEAVVDDNVTMLQEELAKLSAEAALHPARRFFLPYIGVGFGEGDPTVIVPMLELVATAPNIVLVSRSDAVAQRYAASMRPGVRRDASHRR